MWRSRRWRGRPALAGGADGCRSMIWVQWLALIFPSSIMSTPCRAVGLAEGLTSGISDLRDRTRYGII